jgi:hypothetical protein
LQRARIAGRSEESVMERPRQEAGALRIHRLRGSGGEEKRRSKRGRRDARRERAGEGVGGAPAYWWERRWRQEGEERQETRRDQEGGARERKWRYGWAGSGSQDWSTNGGEGPRASSDSRDEHALSASRNGSSRSGGSGTVERAASMRRETEALDW